MKEVQMLIRGATVLRRACSYRVRQMVVPPAVISRYFKTQKFHDIGDIVTEPVTYGKPTNSHTLRSYITPTLPGLKSTINPRLHTQHGSRVQHLHAQHTHVHTVFLVVGRTAFLLCRGSSPAVRGPVQYRPGVRFFPGLEA